MHDVITGGAGFIGYNLATRLMKKRGNRSTSRFTLVDNLATSKKPIVSSRMGFVQLDVRSLLILDFEGLSTVWHLAALVSARDCAKNPGEYYDVNYKGTLNALELARKNDAHFVFTSTSAVYGEEKFMHQEDDMCIPISVYGRTKLVAEEQCHVYSELYGLKCSILRFANVVGEGSKTGIVVDFVNKLKNDVRCLEVLGNGKQLKQYLHVSDAVEAMLFIRYSQKTKFEIYNVGTEECLAAYDIAEIVADELGLHPKIYCKGGKVGWIGDVHSYRLDSSKLRCCLWNGKRWKQSISSEDAIRRTARYCWGEKNGRR